MGEKNEKHTVVDVDVRQILQEAGFIRIDGLLLRRNGEEIQIERSFPGSHRWELWEKEGVVLSARSPKGEIWVGLGKFVDLKKVDELVKKGLIIRGQGKIYIPLSNRGESVSPWDLYRRSRDPDWIPDYAFNPKTSWRP